MERQPAGGAVDLGRAVLKKEVSQPRIICETVPIV